MLKQVIARRKRRRWKRRGILAAIILLPIAFIAWNAVVASRPIPNTSGYPETLDELNAYYEQVPPEENAALVYEQAFALQRFPKEYVDVREEREKNDSWPIESAEPLPEDVKTAMTHDLEANRESIELLYQASTMTKCRFPVDFRQGLMKMKLDHLASIKQSMQLLQFQAALTAENGDQPTCTKAMLAAFAVPQSLVHEPIELSQYLRALFITESCNTLARILNRMSLPDDALASIQEALTDIEQPDAITRALISERCARLACFDDPDFSGGEMLVGPFAEGLAKELSPIDSKIVFNKAYRWSGIRNVDRDAFLKAMDYLIAQSRRPISERSNSTYIERLLSWRTPLSARMIPGWSRRSHRGFVTEVRLAQTAVAIERYRVANASLPAVLSDLVPDYLPEGLTDPFDGEPLRYKIQDDGYIVYSVGPNADDDGGCESKTNPWGEGDIVFAVALSKRGN